MAVQISPPDGDRDRGLQLLVVHAAFMGTLIITLFARLYTRFFIVKKLGVDDYLITLGVICTLVSFVLDIFQVRYGWGRHTYYLLRTPQSRNRLMEALKLSYMNQANAIIGMMFIRLSIGILELRLFGVQKIWRWIVYCILAFVLTTTAIAVPMVFLQCQPLRKLWDPDQDGTCWSSDVIIHAGYYNGAISVISDWALSSVPIAVVWNLQMSRKKKFGVAILMGLGYLTGVTAIIRTVLLRDLGEDDITWNIIPLDSWAGAEYHLGAITACIPTIRPLFSKYRPFILKVWHRIFGSDPASHPTPTYRRPLYRAPTGNPNAASKLFRDTSHGMNSNEEFHQNIAVNWTTESKEVERLPANVARADRGLILEEILPLELGSRTRETNFLGKRNCIDIV